MEKHREYLHRCMELGEKAAAEGESPVGSILVKDGVIIGEAYERAGSLKILPVMPKYWLLWMQ